jgi:glucuronokinase
MIITTQAFARAGLIGNPSDGYFGKTISFVIRNFRARVQIWESPHFEIIPGAGDLALFGSVREFLKDQRLHGYYGGMRLIKAAIKKFDDYCHKNGCTIDLDRSFTVRFDCDIPRLVGLSGSSAITVAMFRALMAFYKVDVPKQILPALALSVEKEELGIAAGLQDRVIQTYEGMVYMDFDKEMITTRGYGEYVPLRPPAMPPLYVAFDPDRAEVSDIAHRSLRQLYDQGDKTVHAAMARYRQLTDMARDALMSGEWDTLGQLMNENFDLRTTIMNIAPENMRMVQIARATGAPAKFAGSGGAIVGLYKDGRHYQQLVDALATIRCSVLRPLIFEE